MSILSTFFKLAILLYTLTSAQETFFPENHVKSTSIYALTTFTNIHPDVIQDDLGTIYGTFTAKIILAVKVDSSSNTYSQVKELNKSELTLVYLSTKANKTNIKLNENETYLIVIKANPSNEYNSEIHYQLANDESIFPINERMDKKLGAILMLMLHTEIIK